MRTACFVAMIAVTLSVIAGCAKQAATAQQSTSPVTIHREVATPKNASDVVVRIRKLGGADGKEVVNQLAVPAAIGDDFNVTEQVGTTQLMLRGKVDDLRNGNYRVAYDYAETSAGGRQQLKSLIEMPLNTEKQIGGLLGRDGGSAMESVVLSLSRP